MSYSPTLGRWLERDPIGFVDGLNLYQYVGGRPTFYVDPSGLAPNYADEAISDLYRQNPEMNHGVGDPTYPLPDAPSNGDMTTPDQLFDEYARGTAPANRYFAPGTPFNNAMRVGVGGRKLAEDIAKQLAAYCAAGGKGPLPTTASSSATTQDFLHDAPHLAMRLGLGAWLFNENTAQMFVGGFTATIKVTDMDCCKKTAKVSITATNISGTASLLRPPGGGPIVPNIPNGKPFGVTSQTWDYEESISWNNQEVGRIPQ